MGQYGSPMRSEVTKLGKSLGEQHPLVAFFAKVVDPVTQKGSNKDQLLEILATRAKLTQASSEATTQMSLLYTRYPLLAGYGFKVLWESTNSWHSELEKEKIKARRRAWREYIRMVDVYLDALDKPAPSGAPVLKLIAGGLNDGDED